MYLIIFTDGGPLLIEAVDQFSEIETYTDLEDAKDRMGEIDQDPTVWTHCTSVTLQSMDGSTIVELVA